MTKNSGRTDMHISVVLGTAREGRQSEKVARYIFNEMSKGNSHSVEFVDVRDCLTSFHTTRYNADSGEIYKWHESAIRSDGFIFVLPEYNHGYPGEWKLLMDSLNKSPYMDKVAGLVGVSSGQFGGARALEAATLSLSSRGMYVMKDTLHFPFVERHFDAEGNLVEEEQRIRVQKFFEILDMTLLKHR